MSFIFSISEGLKGLNRVRGSAIVAVLILSLAISMAGAGAVLVWNGKRLVHYLRSQFDLTIFIKMATPEERISSLTTGIRGIKGVEEVIYVSVDEAARRFEREFGEDVIDVLGENPFPASFIVRLAPEYGTLGKADQIVSQIAGMEGVDEVKYRKTLLITVDRYIKIMMSVGLFIGIIVVLAAVLISANTIKLTIFARREIIRTMRLVGATDSFVRRPFIVEGIVEGVLAGIVSVGIVEASFRIARLSMRGVLPVDRIEVIPEIYFGMIAVGIILGFVGSVISVRRFLRESI